MDSTVRRYFQAMLDHDWAGVRACLADDFHRVGPYPEHVFPDPDAYVEFLSGLLPTLRGHVVEITRVTETGDTAHVEVTETIEVEGRPSTVRVSAAFGLAADGRIRDIEVFVRRPAPDERIGAGAAA